LYFYGVLTAPNKPLVIKKCFLLVVLFMVTSARAQGPEEGSLTSKRITLPNGWSLTPPGKSLPLGDLPLNMTVSHSKKYIAVTNNGESIQSLQLIDAVNQKRLDSVDIPRAWFGLKFSDDDRYLYVSGGNDNRILQYALTGNHLVLARSINLGRSWTSDVGTAFYKTKLRRWILWGGTAGLLLLALLLAGLYWSRAGRAWYLIPLVISLCAVVAVLAGIHRFQDVPEKISPAGLDIDDSNHLLYVVTRENNSLYVINLLTGRTLQHYPIGAEAYTCLLSPDKKELYISSWGGGKVLVFDTGKKKFTADIPVGSNPNDICLTANGHYLFVACANDNAVSVIDLTRHKVIETLNAALYPAALAGSTTNALALSSDEKTLYVANADNNCLAVFDVSLHGSTLSEGFIPVGWYPTAVKVIGKSIYVANAKGFNSLPNPKGPNPAQKDLADNYQGDGQPNPGPIQYIGSLFPGTLSIFPEPDKKQLGVYAAQVYQNTPYTKSAELTTRGEAGNPVPNHVGDPSPIKYIFYIIKENRTYDQVLGDLKEGNGDSGLVLFGGNITPNQHALAKEFVLFDNFYCDAEVSADGHSWSLGAYATDYLEKTWPTFYGGRGGSYDGEGRREVANNKNGFIWDYCKRARLSYRTYGEFIIDDEPTIPSLKGHYCPAYPGWNLSIRDTSRISAWEKDFDSLLSIHALPRLSTLQLGNDHTEALVKGKSTPFAHVADNDLAVGELIEHLSRSDVWKESVVIIVEDDAQNGPDHVDAHRSTVYLAGGLVRHHLVDHTMYSTSSLLRTMELILGLPPMSQYDAAATPLWRSFTASPDTTPFKHLPESVSLDDINTGSGELAKKSAAFDFTAEDRVPEDQFNEVLWKAIKGGRAMIPAAKRAAFVMTVRKDRDND